MKYKSLEKISELSELKRNLEMDMLVEYGKQALKILNIKIGDIVKCEFSGSYISNKQSYGMSKIQGGIIKEDESDIIYVESIEPVQQTHSKSNNRSGRSYKSWWVYSMEITKTELTQIKEEY